MVSTSLVFQFLFHAMISAKLFPMANATNILDRSIYAILKTSKKAPMVNKEEVSTPSPKCELF